MRASYRTHTDRHASTALAHPSSPSRSRSLLLHAAMSAALSYSFPGVRRAAPRRCDPLISPPQLTAGANVIYTYCFSAVCVIFPFFSLFFFPFFLFFFYLFLTEIRYKRQFPGRVALRISRLKYIVEKNMSCGYPMDGG